MAGGSQRLDRFIAKTLGIGRGDTRALVAQKRLWVDGKLAQACDQLIHHFSTIRLDQRILQEKTAHYIMLNKPKGMVSATKDDKHPTVIHLIHTEYKAQLHIVGRLDFNSTGLILLTNDSRWSETLMQAQRKVSKHYHVHLSQLITDDMIEAFAKGIYFPFENSVTAPAQLKKLDNFNAEVILTEGKYHQIKRMFGHFQNQVLSLKSTQIGQLKLDPSLASGEYRSLKTEEVFNASQLQ